MIASYFLIFFARIFNNTTELTAPIGMLTNGANGETETQPLTVEMKIRKCSK